MFAVKLKNGKYILTGKLPEEYVDAFEFKLNELPNRSYIGDSKLIPDFVNKTFRWEDIPKTQEERIITLEDENKTIKSENEDLKTQNKLLTEQVEALSGQIDFQEECLVEMAGVVYA